VRIDGSTTTMIGAIAYGNGRPNLLRRRSHHQLAPSGCIGWVTASGHCPDRSDQQSEQKLPKDHVRLQAYAGSPRTWAGPVETP
jgi:hypothetical protein